MNEGSTITIVIPLQESSVQDTVSIDIYSSKGIFLRRLGATLKEQKYISVWDGLDREQNPVPSGVYFLYLKSCNSKMSTLTLIIFR